MTQKALEKARRAVADAKKKRSSRTPLTNDLKGIVVDTSKLKEKRDATTLLMLLRYGEE